MRDLAAGPVRDVGLLDSAVARHPSSAFGEDAYPTLALNAHEPDATHDAAFDLVMQIAEGALDVEEIADRLHVVTV